jgi:hypothetical protein
MAIFLEMIVMALMKIRGTYLYCVKGVYVFTESRIGTWLY